MVTSIIFLVVFVASVAIGGIVHDWHSWFFGMVFGLSIYEVGRHLAERLERRR